MRCVIRSIATTVVLGLWGVGFGTAEEAFSPLYAARGTVKETVTTEHGSKSFLFAFEVLEDAIGRWRISYTARLPSLGNLVGQIISFDGTNIFTVNTAAETLTFTNGVPILLPAGNVCAASVSAGPYPVDHSSVVGSIWLAFLSGRYLQPGQSSARFPNLTVSDARLDPGAWSCDLVYTLTNVAVRPLLEVASYVLNKHYALESPVDYPELDDPDNKWDWQAQRYRLDRLKDLPTPTLTVGTYQLEEARVFGGILIPTAFECFIEPFPQGGAVTMVGAVTNTLAPPPSNLLPPLLNRADIRDRRFRVKNETTWRRSLRYSLTNSGWIVSTNDARLQSLLGGAPLGRYITDWELRAQKRWSRIGVICVVSGLVLPLLALLLRARGGNRTQEGNDARQ